MDILGKLCKCKNEVWFEHAIPNPVKPKPISKGTSIRFFAEKEATNSMALTKNNFFSTKKEGFLPKIEFKKDF